jgi:hypothetical protein
MKFFLFGIVFLGVFSVHAQRFRVGAIVEYHTVQHNPMIERIPFKASSKPQMSYGFGLKGIWKIKDSLPFYLESGLQYISQTETIGVSKYTTVSDDELTIDTIGNIFATFSLIEIPILFRYEWRFLYASVGPHVRYTQNMNVTYDYFEDAEEEDFSHSYVPPGGLLDRTFLGIRTNLGVQIPIGQTFQVTLHGGYAFGRFAEGPDNKWYVKRNLNAGLGLLIKL